MVELKVGDAAPDFAVKDHTGKEWSLAGLKGKNVVLWFFPKADTPGRLAEGGARENLERMCEGVGGNPVFADEEAIHARLRKPRERRLRRSPLAREHLLGAHRHRLDHQRGKDRPGVGRRARRPSGV